MQELFAKSFGPTSRRKGMPFISYSENFQPGVLSLSSNLTLIPASSSFALISLVFSKTPGSFILIGIITT